MKILATLLMTGIASWYWQPQMMANGKRFNPDAPTCAHKTIKMGTQIKVTNLRNGKTTTCTVTDRGPYIKGRIVDLSRYGAKEIGITSTGLAPVSLELVKQTSRETVPSIPYRKPPQSSLQIPCSDCPGSVGGHPHQSHVAEKQPKQVRSKLSQGRGKIRSQGRRPRHETKQLDAGQVMLRNLRPI